MRCYVARLDAFCLRNALTSNSTAPIRGNKYKENGGVLIRMNAIPNLLNKMVELLLELKKADSLSSEMYIT
jgi:hypothetical protein